MRTILSIDGGGIRGIIPALVLDYLEQQSNKSTSELFDLSVGTSSGGIIALGLAQADESGRPKYSAHDLVDFFENSGSKIFQKLYGAILNRQVGCSMSAIQRDL